MESQNENESKLYGELLDPLFSNLSICTLMNMRLNQEFKVQAELAIKMLPSPTLDVDAIESNEELVKITPNTPVNLSKKTIFVKRDGKEDQYNGNIDVKLSEKSK